MRSIRNKLRNFGTRLIAASNTLVPSMFVAVATLALGLSCSIMPTTAHAQNVPLDQWVRVDAVPDPMMENLTIPDDAAARGMWSRVFDWPMNGLHSMLLPDGKVLTFGSDAVGQQNGRLFDVWDPTLGFGPSSHNSSFQEQQQDSFCSAATFLPDGNLLVTGGNSGNGGYGNGSTIYNPVANTRTTSNAVTALPRWYATMLNLPDGRSLVVGGMMPYREGMWRNPNQAIANGEASMTPEVFENGNWRSLFGANSRDAFGPDHLRSSIPHAWVAPNGQVFGISAEKMWYLDPNANNGSGRTVTVGDFKTPPQFGSDDPVNTGSVGTAVMFDAGKVMQIGGNGRNNGDGMPGSNMATVVDINGEQPVLIEQPRMAFPRRHLNSTVLATGEVVVTGGTREGNNGGRDAVFAAEIWNPDTSTWKTVASAGRIRVYHSQTSLLTNGTILSTGGGSGGPVLNLNGEIFYPPYLFESANGGSRLASRPVIEAISGLSYDNSAPLQFDVDTGQTIVAAALVGLSNGTHGFNPGQRRIPLAISQNGNRVTTTTPNANLTPPGYYQLVAIDSRGVPSNGVIIALGATREPNIPTSPYVPPAQQVDLEVPAISAGDSVSYVFPPSNGARYSWNFGDGSPSTAYRSDPAAQHQFDNPGVYTVTLAIRDSQGIVTYKTYLQAVGTDQTALAPAQSSPILTDNSARVWNVNPDNNSVSVTRGRELIREIRVGTRPSALALSGSSIWVANKASATLSIIETNTLAIINTIDLPRGSQPHGLAISPDVSAVYVVLEATGELLKLSMSGQLISKITIGSNARHVSVTADSKNILVSRFISPPASGESTLSIDTSTANGELVVVNADTMAVRQIVTLRHSDKSDSEIQGAGIPNYLAAAAISPDGTSAWIPSKQDNITRGSARNGVDLDFQNTVRAISSRVDLNTMSEQYERRVDHDNASLASAAVHHPSGAYLFVALETSREVGVIDAIRGNELFRFDVGLAPQGLALSTDASALHVYEFMERGVATFDLTNLLENGQPETPLLSRVTTVSNEVLARNVLQGKKLFYDARDPRLARANYMSCATCHANGAHDGRTWDFTGMGEGVRNTTSLIGRAANGHGLIHWSANFDELQDFEGQIRDLAGGTGLMDNAAFNEGSRDLPLGAQKAGVSEDLDALAAYVASLDRFAPSPFAARDGGLDTTTQAGKATFDAYCASCHAGERFTRSATVGEMADIGSITAASGNRLGGPLNAIDVPTLLDAWATSPYLHNGAASTLEAAITAHDGVSLDTRQMTNLVAYVKQLGDNTAPVETNIAGSATLATSHVSPWETLDAINDGREPVSSLDNQFGSYGNYEFPANFGRTDWVSMTWATPQRLVATEVYWWNDTLGIATPNWARLEYWDGGAWRNLGNMGVQLDRYNRLDHDVTTTAIRISMASAKATGILEMRAMVKTELNAPNPVTTDAPTIELVFPVQTSFSLREAITIGAVANDTDGSVTRVEFYRNQTLLGTDFNAPYSIQWTPTAPGTFDLTARAIDNDGSVTNSTAKAVSVDSGNSAPVVADITASGVQDTAIPATLTGTDNDNDALQFSIVAAPANGTLSGTPPNLLYQPNQGYIGSDSFSYTASDGQVNSNIATVTITIAEIIANTPPVADGSSRTTEVNTAMSIMLRANDMDNDVLTYSVVRPPASGSLTGVAPSLLYTPAADFTGDDSFSFSANDGSDNSNTATIRIRVTELNMALPDAVSNQVTSIELDGNLSDWTAYRSFGADTASDVTDNDTLNWLEAWWAHDSGNFYLAYQNDGNIASTWGQTIYLDTDNDATTGYRNGMAIGADHVIQGDFAYSYLGTGNNWDWQFEGRLQGAVQNGAHEYRFPRAMIGDPDVIGIAFVGSNQPYNGSSEDLYPDTVYTSDASKRAFTYRATRPVNSAPIASDLNLQTPEGQALTIKLGASDFEGDSLTYTLGDPANGFLSGEAPNLTYLPTSDFTGTDQFTYRVNDGNLDSGTATVTINVVAESESQTPSNAITAMTLDGILDEWNDLQGFPQDPAEITNTDVNLIDFRRAAMAHDASTFYISYQLDGPTPITDIDTWVFNVYLDTDTDPTTGYRSSTAIGADYLLQGPTLYQYTGTNGEWDWTALGAVPYASAGGSVEAAIDRSTIGDPGVLDLILIGDNPSLSTPGDQEDAYPDAIYDATSAQRHFSYSTAGSLSSPSTTPLIAPAFDVSVQPGTTQARFENAVEPGEQLNRFIPISPTPAPPSTIRVGVGSMGSWLLGLVGVYRTTRRRRLTIIINATK